jgi:alpha-D-xyloside xylohydrolase/trinucleotide repeat-containing gene 6 protein
VLTALAGRFPEAPAAAPYASWAHSHFVWLDSAQSNQVNVSNLVEGYQKHNITVGAIDIDSAWSTGFNNFVTDTVKFPDLVSENPV